MQNHGFLLILCLSLFVSICRVHSVPITILDKLKDLCSLKTNQEDLPKLYDQIDDTLDAFVLHTANLEERKPLIESVVRYLGQLEDLNLDFMVLKKLTSRYYDKYVNEVQIGSVMRLCQIADYRAAVSFFESDLLQIKETLLTNAKRVNAPPDVLRTVELALFRLELYGTDPESGCDMKQSMALQLLELLRDQPMDISVFTWLAQVAIGFPLTREIDLKLSFRLAIQFYVMPMIELILANENFSQDDFCSSLDLVNFPSTLDKVVVIVDRLVADPRMDLPRKQYEMLIEVFNGAIVRSKILGSIRLS